MGVFRLLYTNCAADFALLNLPKGKSLGRSKPATSSYAQVSCGPLRASKHIRANVFPLAENKLEKLRRHHYAALT